MDLWELLVFESVSLVIKRIDWGDLRYVECKDGDDWGILGQALMQVDRIRHRNNLSDAVQDSSLSFLTFTKLLNVCLTAAARAIFNSNVLCCVCFLSVYLYCMLWIFVSHCLLWLMCWLINWLMVPSVLWCCWLTDRKGIQLVKGWRRGTFTCVWWQVTLCDPMWQVTPRSPDMGSHKELYAL